MTRPAKRRQIRQDACRAASLVSVCEGIKPDSASIVQPKNINITPSLLVSGRRQRYEDYVEFARTINNSYGAVSVELVVNWHLIDDKGCLLDGLVRSFAMQNNGHPS